MGRNSFQDSRYGSQGGEWAQLYAVLARPALEASNVVITGTIIFCDHMTFVLSNSGSDFSYVCVKFSFGWDLDCELLDTPMYMSTLLGYRYELIRFIGFGLTCLEGKKPQKTQ